VPPFVPLNSGAQVQIVSQLDTEIVSSRLWFIYDTPPFTVSDLQGLTDGVALWWTDLILPFLSQDLITANVQADDWTATPAPQQAVTVVNVAGGAASESCTANVAIVVPFRWPLGVRLKRNKNYVPGIPESEIDLNQPSADIRDALFEGYAALIDRTRLFTPLFKWRWVATSQKEAGVLRTEQQWYDVQGPPLDRQFILGQRRKRLPPWPPPGP